MESISSNKDYHKLSAFWLKIIGMISMIFDHISVVYEYNYSRIPNYDINVTTYLRIIGRISFVLFAFISVESITKTKRPIKYLLQLLGLSILCDLGYFVFMHEYGGTPITTLFIGSLTIYLLNKKEWYFKIISLIPIALSILMGLDIIPFSPDYCLYGICVFLIFYISKIISKYTMKYVSNAYSLDEDAFSSSSFALTLKNGIAIALFIAFAIAIYFINPIWNQHGLFTPDNSSQIYAIFAMIPLIFYNEKRGYNKPWFKYGCYAFFPLHIIVTYIIFYILLY